MPVSVNGGINSSYGTVNSNCSDFLNSSSYSERRNKRGSFTKDKLLQPSLIKPRVYKARYLMLFLFCWCTLLNGFQWIQFSIIASIVTCYYDVSVVTTYWTSILFMVMFLPFIIPAAWTMNNKGLRFTLILASAGNSLSACLQCFTLERDRFYVVILTQLVASVAQVFSLCGPAYLAALWFPASSVSVACAVGVFSNQVGVALGLIVPPAVVTDNCGDPTSVRTGLSNLAMGEAVINTLVFLSVVMFFKDKPPTPPSIAEASKPTEQLPTVKSMWLMLKNLNFSLLLVSVGINSSIYFAILTMLNQMVVRKFPGKEVEAGWMGVESTFAGVIGSLISGYILDRTHKYRVTFLLLYFMSLLSMVAYAVVFQMAHLWLYFVMFAILGFTMSSYVPVSYEFAAEITYPEPEGTSTLLLVSSVSLFGIFTTMLASWLQQTYGDMYSNIFFCIFLGVGFFISVFVKCDPKRYKRECSAAASKSMEIPA